MTVASQSLNRVENGVLDTVYTFLNTESIRAFSLANHRTREIFEREDLQRRLLKIHFPNFCPRTLEISSTLYARASVATGTYATRGVLAKELSGHTKEIYCLRISADGTRALSGSVDKTLKLWDLNSGKCLQTFSGHTEAISCLQMSADATRGLSGSWDDSLSLWDLTTGECLVEFFGHSDVVSNVEMSADGTIALSGSDDGTLRLWDLATGMCLWELSEHTEAISCLHMSADGTRALSGSDDRTLRLWDLTTGRCLHELSERAYMVYCLQMSPDGTRALSGSDDGVLRFWDFTISPPRCLCELYGHTDMISCLQMSADGTRALSGSADGTLRFWDLVAGKCLRELSGHKRSVSCLQMSADGTRAFSGSEDCTLKFWDLTTGECFGELSGHMGSAYNVQISSDRARVLSGSDDGVLRLWDLTPLPQERISAVARAFFLHEPYAMKMFEVLPKFVKNAAYRYLYEQHLASGRRVTNPRYGELAFKSLAGFSSTDAERGNTLCSYSKKFYLYDVIDLLKKASYAKRNSGETTLNPTLVFNMALDRFNDLPSPIKNSIYGALYQIHLKAGKLPRHTRSNYGKLTFHNELGHSASNRERIEAIRRVL